MVGDIYLEAAKRYSQFKEGDYEFNSSLNINKGICNYMLKEHLIDVVSSREGLPEMDYFWGEVMVFDGHVVSFDMEGADIRVLILLLCYELCKSCVKDLV